MDRKRNPLAWCSMIASAALMFGCSDTGKEAEEEVRSLARVTITRLADEGDDALTRQADKEIPTTEAIGTDSVRVRYLLVMNCCGQYSGSVRSERDSLFLHVVDASKEACTCESIFELSFIVPSTVFQRSKGLGWRMHHTGMR